MSVPVSRRLVVLGAIASAPGLSTRSGAAAQPVLHIVSIKSFAFEPAHLRVNVGDIIRWTNADLTPHTATADEFSWDTGEISSGASREIEVTQAMETHYFCAFHPHMKGTLTII